MLKKIGINRVLKTGTVLFIVFGVLAGVCRYIGSDMKIWNKSLLTNDDNNADSSYTIKMDSVQLTAKLEKLTNISNGEVVTQADKTKYTNLMIDTDFNFNNFDPSALGISSDDGCIDFSQLKNASGLENMGLSDVGITGGQVEAQYKIGLMENPKTEKNNNIPMEVAILIDNRIDDLSYITNMINEHLYKSPQFVNNDQYKDVKFQLIPYNIDKSRGGDYYYNLSTHNDYKDELQVMLTKFKDDSGRKKVNENYTFYDALKDAEYWFDNNGFPSDSETMLIVGPEIEDEDYNQCMTGNNGSFVLENNYPVITIFLSTHSYGDSIESLSEDYYSNMKKIHDTIGGADTTFHITYNDKDSGNGTNNDIMERTYAADGKCIGDRVAEELSRAIFDRETTISGNLHLNLGKDIRLSRNDTSNSEKTIDSEGKENIDVNIPQIGIESDYSIYGMNYINASDSVIQEFLYDIVANAGSDGSIDYAKSVEYFNEKFKDTNIEVDENDVRKITQGMSSILSNTIGQINLENSNIIYSEDKGIIDKSSYDAVSGEKAVVLLKNYIDDNKKYSDENKKYLLLENLLFTMLKDKIDYKIDMALKGKIMSIYESYPEKRIEIVNNIINGESIDSIIEEITGSRDSDIINRISKTIRNYLSMTFKDSNLYLDSGIVSNIESMDLEEKTLSEILKQDGSGDSELTEVQNEIKSGLSEKFFIPLGLTHIIYRINDNNSIVNITIEPSLKAAVNDSIQQVKFDENTIIRESGKNVNKADKNYLSYTCTAGNMTFQKSNPVDTIPILNLKRKAVTKNHVIYEKIQNKEAVGLNNEGFAKNTVVTCAANVSGASSEKKLYLSINKELGIEHQPKVYYVNDNSELVKICDMTESGTDNENIKYECSIGGDYKNVIVLYSVRLNGSSNITRYENNIKVSGLSNGEGDLDIEQLNYKPAPDLF
ncbi:MAG: hypothetical protein ACI398_01075 [Clostridium sp.]